MTNRALTVEEAGIYARGLFESDFWRERSADLKRRYPQLWVAAVGDRIVATAQSLADLILDVEAQGIDPESVHASFMETKFGHWLL